MVSLDRLIYVYCILQEFCSSFWVKLNMTFYDFVMDSVPSDSLIADLVSVISNNSEFLNSFTLFEFLFGGALVFIIVYNLIRWVGDILPG